MQKYKLLIYECNNLDISLLCSHACRDHYRVRDVYRILKAVYLRKYIGWRVYDINTEDVWRHESVESGVIFDYQADLFHKLFMDNEYVITYDQYKDLTKISGDGPLEVRFWYVDCFASPCLIIILRDLKNNRHKYYKIRSSNKVRKYINLIEPFILKEINTKELFAIKVLYNLPSMPERKFRHYSKMSREEVIDELAMKYISTL